MATPSASVPKAIQYPTSDGRPMGETDLHRNQMVDAIETLKLKYENEPQVYVTGNILVYYVPGDKRRHVSPDLFVVRGIEKRLRNYFLLWEEAKGPETIVEITSKSTRKEDLKQKFVLYRDTFRVPEYFLFDPRAEYLEPRLQGYRLLKSDYVPIRPVKGRLPSKILGLHLEANGQELRFYDPAIEKWLLTPREAIARAQEQAETARQQVTQTRQQAEAEIERLRREIEELRRDSKKQ
jgi:Uma2 family endonuclease